MKNIIRAMALIVSQAAGWAAPLALVCSVDVPVVEPRQAATASVLTDASASAALRYAWKASGGSLNQTDRSSVEWNPNGAATGPYTLTVTVTATDGSSNSCSVVVLVGREERSVPNPDTGLTRQIRSAMLLPGKKEAANFGLYSYMLLGSKPNSSNQERFEVFLKAFTDTVVSYDRLNEQLSPAQLNIAYIPVLDDPPARFEVSWILDHYDYHRARLLLDKIDGEHVGDGPYIISTDHPLEGSGHQPDKFLFQDLSTVPVSIVKFWVNQFRIQTAQARWDHATLSGVALQIRTGIEIAAVAYPEIVSSMKSLLVSK